MECECKYIIVMLLNTSSFYYQSSTMTNRRVVQLGKIPVDKFSPTSFWWFCHTNVCPTAVVNPPGAWLGSVAGRSNRRS